MGRGSNWKRLRYSNYPVIKNERGALAMPLIIQVRSPSKVSLGDLDKNNGCIKSCCNLLQIQDGGFAFIANAYEGRHTLYTKEEDGAYTERAGNRYRG
jgi:hypothetical protein